MFFEKRRKNIKFFVFVILIIIVKIFTNGFGECFDCYSLNIKSRFLELSEKEVGEVIL